MRIVASVDIDLKSLSSELLSELQKQVAQELQQRTESLLSGDWITQVNQLMDQGKKVPAVNLYMIYTGKSICEALEYCNSRLFNEPTVNIMI